MVNNSNSNRESLWDAPWWPEGEFIVSMTVLSLTIGDESKQVLFQT